MKIARKVEGLVNVRGLGLSKVDITKVMVVEIY